MSMEEKKIYIVEVNVTVERSDMYMTAPMTKRQVKDTFGGADGRLVFDNELGGITNLNVQDMLGFSIYDLSIEPDTLAFKKAASILENHNARTAN